MVEFAAVAIAAVAGVAGAHGYAQRWVVFGGLGRAARSSQRAPWATRVTSSPSTTLARVTKRPEHKRCTTG